MKLESWTISTRKVLQMKVIEMRAVRKWVPQKIRQVSWMGRQTSLMERQMIEIPRS